MPLWPRKQPPENTAAGPQPAVKASATTAAATGAAYWHEDSAVWPGWHYSQAASKALQDNPVVQRCVRLVTQGAGSLPWQVRVDGEIAAAHPLKALLAKPNPMMAHAQLVELAAGHLLLHGNAYIEAVRAAPGEPVAELHVLRPDRVTVQPGATGWPEAYIYKVGGRQVRFGVDSATGACDILHLKACNPVCDHYGQSALQAAMNALSLHSAADSWSKSLLDNAARPSGALVVNGEAGWQGLSEDQFERLRAQILENFQGSANAGKPMILEGGLSWQQMAFSPADMDFQATKQAAARDIALAFGVPPMLLGIPGDNTYANYQEANKALWRLTIIPMLRTMIDALNGWLAADYEDAPSAALDEGAIPALAADRQASWALIAAADFLSEDEKRALLGFGPRAA